MDSEEEVQVYVTGIRKYTKDRDFAKTIKKMVPNCENLVLGIFKKRNTACLTVRLTNQEAKSIFIETLTGDSIDWKLSSGSTNNKQYRIKDQHPVIDK